MEVESYSVWPSVSGLSHSASCSQSMCHCFSAFLGLNNIHCLDRPRFVYPLFCGWTLELLHVLIFRLFSPSWLIDSYFNSLHLTLNESSLEHCPRVAV